MYNYRNFIYLIKNNINSTYILQEQLKIDDEFKKVTPYKESKQKELRNSVCDWIVTDGIPFNKVNGDGFIFHTKWVGCSGLFSFNISLGCAVSLQIICVTLGKLSEI